MNRFFTSLCYVQNDSLLSFRACRGIFLLVVFLVAVSCERETDFPADKDGRIFVSAMLGTDGKDRISITVSQPALGEEDATAEDVALYLEADGENVELERDMDDKDGVSYIPQGIFSPGQKLVLRAEADGLPSAKAETRVPESLPHVTITPKIVESYRQDELGQPMPDYPYQRQNFHIVLDEEPEEGSYYGVQVLRKLVYYTVGDVPDYIWNDYAENMGIPEYDNLYVNAGPSESGSLSSIETELIVDHDGGPMRVAIGESEDGKAAIDVYVSVTEHLMRSAQYTSKDGVEELVYAVFELYEYKLKVFRLSPEIFHFFRGRYVVEESLAPIHLGFTPVTYTYTNVEGGLGMFGAVSMYETDWFRVN